MYFWLLLQIFTNKPDPVSTDSMIQLQHLTVHWSGRLLHFSLFRSQSFHMNSQDLGCSQQLIWTFMKL